MTPPRRCLPPVSDSRPVCYHGAMTDHLRTALLLEEKAARLPRTDPCRAYMLAKAKASRQIGLDEAAKRSSQEGDGMPVSAK